MNNRIRALIFVAVIAASAAAIGIYNEEFYGVDGFEFDAFNIIFMAIEFVCICTVCKTNYNCNLFTNHKIIRYRNKKKALLVDIKNRVLVVLAFVLLHSIILFLFNVKTTVIKDYLLYVLLSFLVITFMILLQILIEVRINSDTGYFAVIVGYLAGNLLGIVLYNYYTEHDNQMAAALKVINRFDMINYTSVTRLQQLNVSALLISVILAVLCIAMIILNVIGLKKKDILGGNN